MLPDVDAVFTLVRQLATRSPVTEIAAPKWLVQRHALGPLAARAGIAGYRDDLVRASVFWARVEADLPAITRALTVAGVPVMAIKGAAYARTLYITPAERPMTDVDLMVDTRHVEGARAVLHRLGFERFAAPALHHAEAWARGDFALDLHWSIISPTRSRIDLDAVWRRASPGWPEGAVQLDATDALVFHLVHGIRNRLRLPLVNVVDTARLLERADVGHARERAHAWGLGPSIELALAYHASIVGDDPLPRMAPSRRDAMLLCEPAARDKIVFDVTVAASPLQMFGRVLQVGANLVRGLPRR